MANDTATPPPEATRPPDWSRAEIGDPLPCVRCSRPALLRHPETGRPYHKVCSEPAPTPTSVPVAAEEDRVFYSEDGWTLPHEPGVQPCTINRVPEGEGRRVCTATAVWKVVEFPDHPTVILTLGIWCPDHIPAEDRRFTPDGSAVAPCSFCGKPASLSGPEGKPEHWTCRRKAVGRG